MPFKEKVYSQCTIQDERRLIIIRPNKKMSVFKVTGLKILGRVGTHIYIFFKKSGTKIQFYAFRKAKCL